MVIRAIFGRPEIQCTGLKSGKLASSPGSGAHKQVVLAISEASLPQFPTLCSMENASNCLPPYSCCETQMHKCV